MTSSPRADVQRGVCYGFAISGVLNAMWYHRPLFCLVWSLYGALVYLAMRSRPGTPEPTP